LGGIITATGSRHAVSSPIRPSCGQTRGYRDLENGWLVRLGPHSNCALNAKPRQGEMALIFLQPAGSDPRQQLRGQLTERETSRRSSIVELL